MSFSITGYVLEPPRVGQSNSPFTSTPNNFISDPSAYNTAYPSSEANPRDDYLVLVTSEIAPSLAPGFGGSPVAGPAGLLVNAGFGWTKNEGTPGKLIQRFDYDGHGGRFRTLPGGSLQVAGILGPTSNTQRLTVQPPVQSLPAAPYRLSIGTVGSGTTQTVSLVLNDGAFGSPPAGTTELSLATGHLNWNPADLTTYAGQQIQWQQQQFFALGKSTGLIGVLTPGPSAPAVLLNPIPGHLQLPLLRFGFLLWLNTVEVPNEASFTPFPGPASGTVEWALTTGRLNFSNTDVVAKAGTGVYYDGILFAKDLTLPRQSGGTVSAPTSITLPNPPTGDIIFCLAAEIPYYQFPTYALVTSFSSGQAGTVQVNSSTGVVQFSVADQAKFTTQAVTVVYGDLPIDHGVSIRFFRSPVDLDAQTSGIKDVTALYVVSNAVWANPIMASPQVLLPSVPIDDGSLVITVNQSQGTFTGTLNRVDTPSPPAGLGYYISFDAGTFNFAQRKNNILVPLLQAQGFLQLPDTLLLTSNIVLSLETGTGTNVFTALTPGNNCLVDAAVGLIYFTTTAGVEIDSGSVGQFSGTTFSDSTANFTSAGVQLGQYLVVQGYAVGVYTIASVPSSTSLTVDVNPPAGSGELAYEILSGKEILADRFFETVELIDPTTTVERINVLATGNNGIIIVGSATATFPDFFTVSDLSTDFFASGVQVGDTFLLTSGTDATNTRTITNVAQHTLTISSVLPFTTLVSATYSIYRRLHIPLSKIGLTRIRFGTSIGGTFSTAVNPVSNDRNFTSPGLLSSGVVEVSQVTGNLNFSASNLVGPPTLFYSSVAQRLNTDYQVQPGLGLIQFTTRLMTNEEVLLTYVQAPPVTSPPTPPSPPIVGERGTFIVRKELTQPHPAPTTILSFNPTGKSVASNPPPAVFRGGRPQVLGTQCTVNTTDSTITFLPDSILTDALPHGAVIAPTENVYIDYYVYQAMGGERTLTVLNPPMLVAQVTIVEGAGSFIIAGNFVSDFPTGFLLLVGAAEVYELGIATYNALLNQTTVSLSGSQAFQSNQTNPALGVVSGPTPLVSAPLVPAYFVPELQAFSAIARGSNSMMVVGDRTVAYRTNTIVYFTDGLSSFTDFLIVTGAKFDQTTGSTTITFASNALRQYIFGQQILSYSVRPIFNVAPTVVHTSRVPVAGQPVTVFRRVAGEVGVLLSSPTGYAIDSTGTVTFASPLTPGEEFSIFYTGHRIVAAGPRVQASYSSTIAPTQLNGLLGQILTANYHIFSPDNFYYRVETMTNFKGEVEQAIQQQAMSGSPSSGPMTSNTSQPTLSQQGRPSIFFDEGHLANEDIIARACLKFFNDAVNSLEDALHAIDGRVVGDQSGRFVFDGIIGRTISGFPPTGVLNQIDDLIHVSPFPLPNGTIQQIYLAGPYSRFFTTKRNIFTTSPAVSGHKDGDPIAQYTFKNLSSLPGITFKRWPRAQIQFSYPTGTQTFTVDNANGTNDALQRPSFITNMRVVIQDALGTFYLLASANVTVSSFSATSITLSSPVGVAVPAGATIYMSPTDASSRLDGSLNGYQMLYQFGKDLNANLSTGELLYIPAPAVAFPLFPTVNPVQAGDILQANQAGVNITTTAPYEFPALTGGTTDDNGDQAVPIVGPTFDGEMTPAGGGPLNSEQAAITLLGSIAAPTFVGTGTLSNLNQTITLTSGTFPTTPKQHDLVRILTGANAGSTFRHIATGATSTSLTVLTIGEAFSADISPFSFAIVTTSSSLVHTGTGSVSGTAFTDLTALFTTDGTQQGFTLVVTSGANASFRRQVVAVLNNTHLTLDHAFPTSVTSGFSYRIDNTLDTYNGPVLTTIESAVATELATILTNTTSEQNALLAFFTTVFTTVVGPSTATVSGTTLTDLTVDFVASGVTLSDLVYIHIGVSGPQAADMGLYQIGSITDSHHLALNQSIPTAGSVTYEIVSLFGTTYPTLNSLFGIIIQNASFVTATEAWQTILTSSVAVFNDPSAFAISILPTDISTRTAAITARLSYLNNAGSGPIAVIEGSLSASDQLYAKRYTWIDARINQQTGYLVLEQRAVSTRIQTQQDVYKELIKLLTVQGS